MCAGCGHPSHHQPVFCGGCGLRFRQAEAEATAADRAKERKRVRKMYMILGGWVLGLGGLVAYTAMDDPTGGHAGRIVFPSESAMEAFRRNEPPAGEPLRAGANARPFRLSKSDRVEKMGSLPMASAAHVWIRITEGPHAGRSGVIDW